MKKTQIIILLVILASFAVSIFFYPQMPNEMASHWNAQGEVDGYTSRFWETFLLPFTMIILALFFAIIPKIDPLKENIEKFRKYFDGFIILFLVFMLLVHFQIILWNFGIQISPNTIMPIAIGFLFFYIGILLKNAKRNWFIGIRTPWTLSSENVWNKTHKIGAKLFKIAGIISIIGVFFQSYSIFFILIPTFFTAFYLIVYSYFEYQKEKKNDKF
jgi:uncharacterized membrane protein